MIFQNSGYRIMAIIRGFQPFDESSILSTRSIYYLITTPLKSAVLHVKLSTYIFAYSESIKFPSAESLSL